MFNAAILGAMRKHGSRVSGYSAKSVILDLADNWGGGLLSLGAVLFYSEGALISIGAANSTTYATSELGSYIKEHVFDTSLPLTGAAQYNAWFASSVTTNQRIIIVFDTLINFDQIKIHNTSNGGNNTDLGAKNVVVTISTDAITSTVYGSAISNSAEIFNGVFDEHVASDVEDPQTLTLI